MRDLCVQAGLKKIRKPYENGIHSIEEGDSWESVYVITGMNSILLDEPPQSPLKPPLYGQSGKRNQENEPQ